MGCNMIGGAIMLFLNYFYTDIFYCKWHWLSVQAISVRYRRCRQHPDHGRDCQTVPITRWGRFRPYFCYVGADNVLFSVLMFTTPEWSYNSKVIYAFVTYFLMSLTYTAINIPYCSGGATADPYEQAFSLTASLW